jgi:hypothetical protein
VAEPVAEPEGSGSPESKVAEPTEAAVETAPADVPREESPANAEPVGEEKKEEAGPAGEAS